MAFCQNALLPELNQFNLFQIVTKIQVPVHFIQGNLDAVAPASQREGIFMNICRPRQKFHPV